MLNQFQTSLFLLALPSALVVFSLFLFPHLFTSTSPSINSNNHSQPQLLLLHSTCSMLHFLENLAPQSYILHSATKMISLSLHKSPPFCSDRVPSAIFILLFLAVPPRSFFPDGIIVFPLQCSALYPFTVDFSDSSQPHP